MILLKIPLKLLKNYKKNQNSKKFIISLVKNLFPIMILPKKLPVTLKI